MVLLGFLCSASTFAQERGREELSKKQRFALCRTENGWSNDSIATYEGPCFDAKVEADLGKPGRALLELAALQTYSTIRYWLTHRDRLEGIHKYEFNWADQKRRIFDAKNWHFDSNCFSLNWTHYLAGALYYNIARTNDLSQRDSILLTLAASTFWELLVEHRSDISVNDNIITPFGGLALGEAWYSLGRYLTDKSGLAYSILGFLHPVMKLNRWLDGDGIHPGQKPFEPGWHELKLSLGYRILREGTQPNTQNQAYLRFHSQFIHPHDYGSPGRIDRMFLAPVSSEIDFDLSPGKKGVEEFNLFSRLVLSGYLKQNIEEDGTGYACYWGLSSAFTLFKKRVTDPEESCRIKPEKGRPISLEDPRGFSDKFSIVHLIGPIFDLTLMSRDLRLRLLIDAYLDFSLVNAFALNSYSIAHDISGAKSTLIYYGYYYSLGTTLSSRLILTFGKFLCDGSLRYHFFDSIEWGDALQEDVTDDFNLRDSMLRYRVRLAYHLRPAPIEIAFSYEGISRSGRIKDIIHKGNEDRFIIGAGLKF